MADEIRVSVTLRWEGNRLMSADFIMGWVEKWGPGGWQGYIFGYDRVIFDATEAEARAAVEAAAIKALGGVRDE